MTIYVVYSSYDYSATEGGIDIGMITTDKAKAERFMEKPPVGNSDAFRNSGWHLSEIEDGEEHPNL